MRKKLTLQRKRNKLEPTIGIIGGKGTLGSLFVEFFRNRGVQVLVSDLDTELANDDLVMRSDIVIVSVPIIVTAEVIRSILPLLRADQALVDFTSLKNMPLNEMMQAECEVLGLHPMFGASNPLPGQTIIFCETDKSGEWSAWLREFFLGNEVLVVDLTPDEHDRFMAVSQALVHFADIAFADAIRRSGFEVKELLRFAGKASELKVQLAARLINQDPHLYGSIQMENPHFKKQLKNIEKAVSELAKIVEKKDHDKFCEFFVKNKEFYDQYAQEAYEDSSYLIEKFIEKKGASGEKGRPHPPKADSPDSDGLALLGPPLTFSDLGADHYLRERHLDRKKFFAETISDVFELVEKGKVQQGIVPVENLLHGTVRETLDALFYKNVHIVDEINLPIKHCLICLPKTGKSDIQTIISHEQALNQSRKFLKSNFPDAKWVSVASTATAIQRLLDENDHSTAVVAPPQAAEASGLNLLEKGIQDSSDNSTRFVIIEAGKVEESKVNKSSHNKTSIAFYFDQDSAGSLFGVFEIFAKAKVNLTKIESRPARSKFGDYIFYLDFEGNISDSHIQNVLLQIESKVAHLKVLGSY